MLHDIFKRKKSKIKKKLKQQTIIIDNQEKNSLVPSYLTELKAKTEFKHLKIGDYLINKIIIERKTFQDFISSMIKKRLIQQLNNLKKYKQKILIIENHQDIEEQSNLNNAARGQILSILLNHQIPIVFTNSAEDTARYLHLLAKQQAKEKQEISLHSRIPKTTKQQKQYILEGFPGIGPITSKKLLKKHKTLKNIINSDEETLNPILKSKTKQFLDLLNKS